MEGKTVYAVFSRDDTLLGVFSTKECALKYIDFISEKNLIFYFAIKKVFFYEDY